MREINKTIYELAKVSDSDEDVSVTQLITDEVVKQTQSGEIESSNKEDATGLLDRKALEIHGDKTDTAIRRQIKASGGKSSRQATGVRKVSEIKEQGSSQGKKTKKVSKKSSGGTQTRKVVKVAKKKTSKTAKKAVKKQGTDTTVKIAALVLALALAGYLYMELF